MHFVSFSHQTVTFPTEYSTIPRMAHPNSAGGTTLDRIAIFIDGANMFYAQRKLGWHIDYKKVYDFYAQEGQIYNAFYYTSVVNPPDQAMEGFLRALTSIGYTVRRKVIKEILDQESGQVIRKANLDIEIVIDMLTTADLYDRAVLISGDGDFERAVEYLRLRGKRIEGLGMHAMAAYDLVNAMDRYRYLEDLRPYVEKVAVGLDASELGEGEGPAPADGSAPVGRSALVRPSRSRVAIPSATSLAARSVARTAARSG
jgi:uncharacterized LabA/DUF88 family protein